MARAFAALAFAVVVLLPLIPAPASATSVVPGWNVFLASPVVFAGDPVNITVKGVDGNQSVELHLTDPNGTLEKRYFPRYRNTIAIYNFTTKLNDAVGEWTVTAYLEGHELAFAKYELRWDELNYAQKRISLLEKQNTLQQTMIKQNADEIHDMQSTIFWVFLTAVLLFTAVAFIGFWAARFVSWPLYCFLKACELEFGRRQDTAWRRLVKWLTNPYPATSLAAFHEDMRSLGSPKWPAAAMAQRARQYAATHGVTFPAEVPKGPVKRKRVVAKPKGGD